MGTASEPRCLLCDGPVHGLDCTKALSHRIAALEAAGKVPGGALCGVKTTGKERGIHTVGLACTLPEKHAGDWHHNMDSGAMWEASLIVPAPEAGRCDERCLRSKCWCGYPRESQRHSPAYSEDWCLPLHRFACSGPAHQPAPPAVTETARVAAVTETARYWQDRAVALEKALRNLLDFGRGDIAPAEARALLRLYDAERAP